ncbi:DUF63 family protein [Candidatus Micrarchaeota archaeon]|nr:DUF63 family protein [Candidatus Micrarchaeota archaeon]
MTDFIQEYFLNPLQYPDVYPPYNAVNTITFAVLALVTVWVLYKHLKKLGVKYDDEFFFAILSFVSFGAIVRVIVDSEILPRSFDLLGVPLFLLVTPGIYVFTFAALMLSLYASLRTSKPMITLRNIGIGLSILAFLPLLTIASKIQFDVLIVLAITIAIILVAGWGWEKAFKKKLSNIDKALLFGQVLDGAAAFYGIDFKNYAEQHVVGNAVISLAGTALGFLALKTVFALAAIYFLQQEKEGEQKTFIALIITIVGFGPGLRSFLRILFNV